MEKELFKKAFIDKLNKNFQSRSEYFDFDFHVFSELSETVFEINKCLILEFYRASITLTNNLLERLLKLSLIYNELGIGSKPENWNSIFEKLDKKYNSLRLANSIERCRKLELITEREKMLLFNKIRKLMRNGFSHADSTEILSGLPDESTLFQSSFLSPNEINQVALNPKVIPFIQTIQMGNFAKQYAAIYFDYVYKLIKKMDQRLIDRNEKNS